MFRCGLKWLRHTVCCATYLPQVAFWSLSGGDFLLSVPGGPPILLYIVPTVIDCLFRALGPSDYVLTVCHFGPLSVAVSPSERCVSCCVLGGSIGRVVDFWPSLPFGGSPRGRFCTASSCLSSGSSNLLRSGHQFRWAGILADLCTGKPVCLVSFGVVFVPQYRSFCIDRFLAFK